MFNISSKLDGISKQASINVPVPNFIEGFNESTLNISNSNPCSLGQNYWCFSQTTAKQCNKVCLNKLTIIIASICDFKNKF